MLTAIQYAERDTLVQRLDMRSRLIFYGCFVISVLLFWDLRVLSVFLGLALAAVLAARLPWRETRRAWLAILGVITFYAALTLFVGPINQGGGQNVRPLMTLQAPFSILGWQPSVSVSVESVFYACSMFVRILSISALTILIPFTFDPALYGVAFHQLGLPDKLAFALDLTLRFVPTLSRDFGQTIDAQRARGYELEAREGGLTGRIRRLAPLLVPVVIHSIVDGEEITDAMDLRAFGTQRRTWLRTLHYARRDHALIAFSLAMLAVSIALRMAGLGGFWAP